MLDFGVGNDVGNDVGTDVGNHVGTDVGNYVGSDVNFWNRVYCICEVSLKYDSTIILYDCNIIFVNPTCTYIFLPPQCKLTSCIYSKQNLNITNQFLVQRVSIAF